MSSLCCSESGSRTNGMAVSIGSSLLDFAYRPDRARRASPGKVTPIWPPKARWSDSLLSPGPENPKSDPKAE